MGRAQPGRWGQSLQSEFCRLIIGFWPPSNMNQKCNPSVIYPGILKQTWGTLVQWWASFKGLFQFFKWLEMFWAISFLDPIQHQSWQWAASNSWHDQPYQTLLSIHIMWYLYNSGQKNTVHVPVFVSCRCIGSCNFTMATEPINVFSHRQINQTALLRYWRTKIWLWWP